MAFKIDDPLLAATIDRTVYLVRKGVINRNQAFWQLSALLREGRMLSEAERLDLSRAVTALLDGHGRSAFRTDSVVVAARLPRRVVTHIDDFASAYGLTRSQCLGLALDLVYGQEWQLEVEPWKRRKSMYGEGLSDFWKPLTSGLKGKGRSRRLRTRSECPSSGCSRL